MNLSAESLGKERRHSRGILVSKENSYSMLPHTWQVVARLTGCTDHCIEVLRQNIQCNADIGLFTFYMIPDDPLAWPELNSKHVCRNFDGVRKWALDNSVGNMEILEQ